MIIDKDARLSENVEVDCGGDEGLVKLQDASEACLQDVVEQPARQLNPLVAPMPAETTPLSLKDALEVKAWEIRSNLEWKNNPAFDELRDFMARSLRMLQPDAVVLTNPFETGSAGGPGNGAPTNSTDRNTAGRSGGTDRTGGEGSPTVEPTRPESRRDRLPDNTQQTNRSGGNDHRSR